MFSTADYRLVVIVIVVVLVAVAAAVEVVVVAVCALHMASNALNISATVKVRKMGTSTVHFSGHL